MKAKEDGSVSLDEEQVTNIKKLLASAATVVQTAESEQMGWMNYQLAAAIRDLDNAHNKCWEYFTFT